jgi:hypothetical protein
VQDHWARSQAHAAKVGDAGIKLSPLFDGRWAWQVVNKHARQENMAKSKQTFAAFVGFDGGLRARKECSRRVLHIETTSLTQKSINQFDTD